MNDKTTEDLGVHNLEISTIEDSDKTKWVKVDFKTSLTWIEFPADEAIEFAKTILKHAEAIQNDPQKPS